MINDRTIRQVSHFLYLDVTSPTVDKDIDTKIPEYMEIPEVYGAVSQNLGMKTRKSLKQEKSFEKKNKKRPCRNFTVLWKLRLYGT